MRMLDAIRDGFGRRYLELLGSIYIYNEHRGYTALDRVLEAVRAHCPGDEQFIAEIEKHRADEHKHYVMFRRWFERRGVMPFAVDRTCGHIDRFVGIMFRSTIDRLDTGKVMHSRERFARLCRVIALTERRGYRQVDVLLRHPIVRRDRILMKIFGIIEQDEPSHWGPYEAWLAAQGQRAPVWWERLIDKFIHSELMVLKIPVLFAMPRLRRLTDWPHAVAPASPSAGLPQAVEAGAVMDSPLRDAAPSPPGLAARLLSRNAGAMLARNTVVSCLVFALNLALLWLLVERLAMPELAAAALAFLAANSLQYGFGRAWIFRGTDRAMAAGYVYFFINAGIGLAITLALYTVFLELTSIHYIVARIIVSIFAGLTVFALNATLNFRRL